MMGTTGGVSRARRLCTMALGAWAASACASSVETDDASGGGDAGSLEVPITVTAEDGGVMSFSVPIRVGSVSLNVLLDTGSSGLRVAAGAVPDEDFERVTSTQVIYSYHSGVLIQGVVAYASVAIGSLGTPAPIPVMIVQQASCTAAKPDCPASGSPPGDLASFGPYAAILGVGMRSTLTDEQVGNPISQLEGKPAFIVKAPSYGGTAGTLELAPTASEVMAFATRALPLLEDGAPLANGTPAYDDRYGLPACLDDLTSGVDYCVPAELDTGNAPTYIEWPAHGSAPTSELPPGDRVEATIGPPSAPLERYGFTVGSNPTPGIDEVLVESASAEGFMNLGTVVFFHYDVYFDPEKGVVGFGPH
jgi:Protein of unknown function (DUF3443)